MEKSTLEQILKISKEKNISEKQACLEITGKEIQLSYYKKKFGIKLNPMGKAPFTARVSRNHIVNDEFFSTITDINSYYAGFIAADGNINKDRPNLTIALSSKDRYFLETFLKTIKSDYGVHDYDSHGFPASSIIITSNKICEDLNKIFNITPNKSLTYVPPILDLPYLDCFIMGLIDGDGSIGFQARKKCNDSLYISIAGTFDTCNLVKTRFEEILGKETSNLFQKDSNKNFYSYRVSDRNARNIFIFYYEKYNYLPVLNRKWTKEYYNYCINWKKSQVPSRQKGVNIFNLNGIFIKSCKTLKEAENFTGTASSTISKICKEDNNKHQSNGYMFSRTKVDNMEPYSNNDKNMQKYINKFLNKEQKDLDKGITNIEDEQ